jgi:hypothetical protein
MHTMQETTTLAVEMNDRLGRRLVLLLNNDQRCVVAAWIEEGPGVTLGLKYGETLSNTQFYERLEQKGQQG